MKKNNLLLVILIILFNFYSAFSQEADSVYFEADTLDVSDIILDEDTTLIEKIEIDEDLGDIFSAQIDSSSNAWHIKNAFANDSADMVDFEYFPKNLPDSVYMQRLIDAEQVIYLSYNKVVRNFIQMYTERKRNQVEMMLGLSEYYFPIFEETLDKYNLPLELKYLPVIESALNPKALSRVGASGLWQ